MSEQNNVITIDGAEYEERSLEAVSQYFIAQIRDLQTQRGQLQFQLDQKQAALDVMTAKLIESVKSTQEEVEVEKEQQVQIDELKATIESKGVTS